MCAKLPECNYLCFCVCKKKEKFNVEICRNTIYFSFENNMKYMKGKLLFYCILQNVSQSNGFH